MSEQNSSTSFLLLSWQELFDPFTPDTYQPRLNDVPSLIEELRIVSKRAIGDTRWNSHVEQLRQELKALLAEDNAFLESVPTYRWSAQHLATLPDPRDIESVARVLNEQQSRLTLLTSQRLKRAASRLPKEKEAAVKALRRLATLSLKAEHSPSDLLSFATEKNLKLDSQEIVSMFINTLKFEDTDYECYLTLQGPPSDIQGIIRKTNFQLRKRPDCANPSVVEYFKIVSENIQIVKATMNSRNAAMAAKLAARRLRQVTDIFNMYQNAQSMIILNDALVGNGTNYQKVSLADSSLGRLRPRKDSRGLTQELLDKVTEERLEGRIINSLEHYALAHSSAGSRVKLVNLWSALECLVGARPGESIISAVCDAVGPIIAWRRIDKLVRYFAICLQHLRSSKGSRSTGDLGEGFNAAESHIAPERVLLALARPNKHPHILSLFKYTQEHALLCNRTYQLWKTFHRPKDFRMVTSPAAV